MESRITELEIKVSYQDDLLETLNDIVTQQQQHIDRLQQQLQALYQWVQSGVQSGGASVDDPRHEIPPHY